MGISPHGAANLGLGYRTDTGQVIDTEGVTPTTLKARELRDIHEDEPAQVELIMSTGIGEAACPRGGVRVPLH